MDLTDSISSLFKDWLKDRGTKRALLGYSLLIILVLGGILKLLNELGANIPASWSILIIGVVLLLNLLLWVWHNRIYPLYISKIKIAFSLEVENQDPLLKEIRKEFDNQLDILKAKDKIKVIDLPSDKKFGSETEAEKYCKMRDINLLIWGHTKRGKLEGDEIVDFKLKLTYIYRRPVRKVEELLRSDIKSAIIDRNWKIVTKNSFQDIDFVTKDLMEVSLFIIGLCLLLEQDLERCIEVFDKLDNCLQQARFGPHQGRDAFTKRFRIIFIDALGARGITLYYENKTEEWKKILERMLQIDITIPAVHINLARLYYLGGNIQQARFHTNQAEGLTPGHPWVLLNKAFFSVLDRKFDKAAKFYEELSEKFGEKGIQCNPLEVALFLEDEWRNKKDNLGFLFAAGFINYYFADKRRGWIQIKKFIRKIGDSSKEYAPLYVVADRMIKHKTSI